TICGKALAVAWSRVPVLIHSLFLSSLTRYVRSMTAHGRLIEVNPVRRFNSRVLHSIARCAVAVTCLCAPAQSPAQTASAEAPPTFAKLCTACHGEGGT